MYKYSCKNGHFESFSGVELIIGNLPYQYPGGSRTTTWNVDDWSGNVVARKDNFTRCNSEVFQQDLMVLAQNPRIVRGRGRPPLGTENMELHKFYLRRQNAAGVSDFEFLKTVGGSAAVGLRRIIDDAIEKRQSLPAESGEKEQ